MAGLWSMKPAGFPLRWKARSRRSNRGPAAPVRDDFDLPELGFDWVYVRNPAPERLFPDRPARMAAIARGRDEPDGHRLTRMRSAQANRLQVRREPPCLILNLLLKPKRRA